MSTESSRSVSLSALLPVFLISISLKLLLLPAPHSTDLDVHRFWKSLTYHKGISKWYEDESSIWTLDYPPLFAYFEWILAKALTFLHPTLTDPDYSVHTEADVLFLRISVLFCEPLLLYSIHKHASLLHPRASFDKMVIAFALPGLTLVDNIHFQYNSLPLSIFLLSIYNLCNQKVYMSTILFCITLNLKQTFLPLLPIYIITILNTINHKHNLLSTKITTFCTTALTALISLLLPWLPFIMTTSTTKVLNRLFPLHRGLLHANWAPNIWAPYATLDRLLTYLTTRQETPSTRGLINIMRPFTILPNPTPLTCTLLTLLSTIPFTILLLKHPTPQNITASISASALSAFIFGWHVHEKAILLALLPLSLTTQHQEFIWISIGAQFALFELLRYPQITPFLLAHFIAFHAALFGMYQLPRAAVIYFVGCFVVEAYSGVLGIHRLLFGHRLEFFPIMLVSLYAFVGVAVGYALMLQRALQKGKSD